MSTWDLSMLFCNFLRIISTYKKSSHKTYLKSKIEIHLLFPFFCNVLPILQLVTNLPASLDFKLRDKTAHIYLCILHILQNIAFLTQAHSVKFNKLGSKHWLKHLLTSLISSGKLCLTLSFPFSAFQQNLYAEHVEAYCSHTHSLRMPTRKM